MTFGIKFSSEIRLGDLVSSLSFLAAATGLLLNWWQYRRKNKTDRAVMLKDLYSPFFSDPERLLGHGDMIAVVFDLVLFQE